MNHLTNMTRRSNERGSVTRSNPRATRLAAHAIAWLAPLCLIAPAHAHEWLAECNIRFDNEFALTNVYRQARGTFAEHTGIGAGGVHEPCNASHLACWTYRERCGSRGYVNVEEAPIGTYNHFHLLWQDPEVDCYAPASDGLGAGGGRGDYSSCVAVDWKREPRVAAGHDANHMMKVWIDDRVTHQPRIFDIASILVRGTMPAEIWFQKDDGSWWYWPSLAPNRWNLSEYTFNIRALYIKAAAGSTTSVSFDDVVVRN